MKAAALTQKWIPVVPQSDTRTRASSQPECEESAQPTNAKTRMSQDPSDQEDHDKVRTESEVMRTVEVHHSEHDLLYIKLHTTQLKDHQAGPSGAMTVRASWATQRSLPATNGTSSYAPRMTTCGSAPRRS